MNQTEMKNRIFAILGSEGVKFESLEHKILVVERLTATVVQECAGLISGNRRAGQNAPYVLRREDGNVEKS